jgi:hypothetical protein
MNQLIGKEVRYSNYEFAGWKVEPSNQMAFKTTTVEPWVVGKYTSGIVDIRLPVNQPKS